MRYKIQVEILKNRVKELEGKLAKESAKVETKKYEATVYCQDCKAVQELLIPDGVSLFKADCFRCKVYGRLLPVSYYPKCNWRHF